MFNALTEGSVMSSPQDVIAGCGTVLGVFVYDAALFVYSHPDKEPSGWTVAINWSNECC